MRPVKSKSPKNNNYENGSEKENFAIDEAIENDEATSHSAHPQKLLRGEPESNFVFNVYELGDIYMHNIDSRMKSELETN